MAKTLVINGITYDVSGGKIQAPLASDPSKMAAYFDVSDVDTKPEDVKAGQQFYAGDEKRTGTMPVNEAVNKTLDASDTQITVPAGYTPGGTVKIVPETKIVTPSGEQQTITPEDGKVLAKVVVEKVSETFGEVANVTAAPEDVKAGKKFVDATGALKEGTHTDPQFVLANGVLTIK